MNIPPPPPLYSTSSDAILSSEWDTIRVMEEILRDSNQVSSSSPESSSDELTRTSNPQESSSSVDNRNISVGGQSRTGSSNQYATMSIQIMRDAPDVMVNHNNTLNQAPRGRQKKRTSDSNDGEMTSHDNEELDAEAGIHQKKPRAFQNSSSTLTLANKANSGNVAFPRILKRDLRRVFGQMYLNVLNSGDPILFARFMRQYVNYNAQYQRFVADSPSKATTEQSRDIPTIIGRDAIMYFLASHHETAPDTVTMCQQGSIRQHLHSPTSEIVLQVKMAGTRLYMIEWQELMQLIASTQQQQSTNNNSNNSRNDSNSNSNSDVVESNQSSSNNNSNNNNNNNSATSRFLEQFRRAQQFSFPPNVTSSQELTELALLHFTDRMKRVMLTSPAKFEMIGTFTLYLDECFNVYRFDFARHSLELQQVPELNPYNNSKSSETAATAAAAGNNSNASDINNSRSNISTSAHWIVAPKDNNNSQS